MKAVFVGFLLSLGSTPVISTKYSRIVNGVAANIEKHPYQLSLRANNVHICGAVLTSSNTAITAAHCVFGKIGRVNFSIRAGSSYLNSGGEMHYVSYVSIHPNYNSNNQDYDIAILFLKSLLRFGRTIRPVDLPIFEQRVADNTPAVVTGYGAVYEGGNAEWRMRATIVRVVGHKKCEKIYHGNMVTERMLCAGGGKEDACEGDSGGPLVANNTLIGIVSWGTACGAIGIPGIYTNVMKLLSFLRIFIHE